LGALIAVNAKIDIHVAGTVVNLNREISGKAGSTYDRAVGHDLDAIVLAVVEQEGGDGGT
jgi:hypothetical protein